MAQIKLKIQSLGANHEKCEECDKQFSRGEQMNGVEYDDGSPAGWYCDDCISNWLKTGKE
jgi:hypothetical protein